ncbi:MAG: STAS domain-containing protein [Verrucomicrobiales bacterium]
MTPHARILAGNLHNLLWLRVSGRGSHEISPQLKDFAADRIEGGARHFVVDLEACPAMDSTFMGTLTGIAVRLMAYPDGRLQVVNANERNRGLLANLGLDQVFEVDKDGSAWTEEREIVKASLTEAVAGHEGERDDSKRRECVIEAHENLCKANEANRPKFRDVLDCLKNERESQPA